MQPGMRDQGRAMTDSALSTCARAFVFEHEHEHEHEHENEDV